MSYSLIEAKINQCDHLCSFYENKEEQFQVVIPFLVEGLEKKEKCLYLGDETTLAEIKAGLVLHGIDVNHFMEIGQLSFMTANESYLRPGKFSLDSMISQLKEFSESAQTDGYEGSRVAGEVTWLIRQLDSLDEFFEYEATLDNIFSKKPIKMLCQYNSKKFFGNVIVRALQTHQRVLIGLNLFENIYYKHK